MNYPYHCVAIPTESLTPADTAWDLHPFLPETETIFQSPESIGRVGLLYLPLVRLTASRSYELITGNRCYNYIQSLQPLNTLYCRVVRDDISMVQLLTLIYEEYSLGRQISAIELAYFIQLCQLHLSKNDLSNLFRSICFSDKPHLINRTLELLALEYPLQASLMNGFLSENIARELLRLTHADRQELFSVFVHLNIGGGKQKRLLALIKDLAGRTGISLQDFIRGAAVQTILNHPEMNIPQKTQNLLQHLQLIHSPTLVEAENQFNMWRSSLNLPEHCTVTHSQAFEQDSVTFSVKFKNRKKLEESWKSLKPFMLPDA